MNQIHPTPRGRDWNEYIWIFLPNKHRPWIYFNSKFIPPRLISNQDYVNHHPRSLLAFYSHDVLISISSSWGGVYLIHKLTNITWPQNHCISICTVQCFPLEIQKTMRILDTTLCNNVCQWLATGRWFSQGAPVSCTNKTDSNDIAEILLKVVLNTINQATPKLLFHYNSNVRMTLKVK
jgi:hypothetical protein